MTDRGRERCRVGRATLGSRHAGFMLGVETRGDGTPGFCFLFGTTPGFARRLLFGGNARQGRRFGDLLGTYLLGRQIGGMPFGGNPFPGQTGELLFFLGAGGGGGGQLGGGKLAALCVGQGALLGLDSRAQRKLGQALDMCLLRRRCLCRRFGGGAADRVLRRKLFRLLAPLRGGRTLGGQGAMRFGDRTGAFFRGGAGQSIRFSRALGIGRICCGCRGTLQTLPLRLHQSIQELAQAVLPIPEKPQASGRDSLTQTRHGPKVE